MGRSPIISPTFYPEIIQKYLKGDSLINLGKKHNVAKETIKLILTKNNINPRTSDEVNRPWKGDINLITKFYIQDKMSLLTIAKKLDIKYKCIRNFFIRNKIPLRTRYAFSGRPLSEEAKNKIRITNLGEKNPNFGGKSVTAHSRELLRKSSKNRIMTMKTRIKISETRKRLGLSKGDKNPMKNSISVKKWAMSNSLKPNKQEIKVESILNQVFPHEYLINVTGDYLILNGKIPDFVCIKKRKLIEFYGDYWHKNDKEEDRINAFKEYGYDTLIIWEKDLKNIENVKNSVLTFHNKGTANDLC